MSTALLSYVKAAVVLSLEPEKAVWKLMGPVMAVGAVLVGSGGSVEASGASGGSAEARVYCDRNGASAFWEGSIWEVTYLLMA